MDGLCEANAETVMYRSELGKGRAGHVDFEGLDRSSEVLEHA